MKVCEIFKSIQGEGAYVGNPALFIRLSGCTRKCSFCDSKYHTKFVKFSVDDLVKKIIRARVNIIVWTGGEPALQQEEIYKVIKKTSAKQHHLETNGDIKMDYNKFSYTCCSPKDRSGLLNFLANNNTINFDIKVVTDLYKLNINMLKEATIIMPLTTYNETKDLKLKQKVWKYCIEHNKTYSPRLHVDLWGKKRKI